MIKTITTKKLYNLIQANKMPIILDVRFENELKYGQISKNQIFIPLPELPKKINELEKYRNQEIIVYCRSGGRSHRAVEFLLENGFKFPINLVGGILAYREFDQTIHPY